MIFEFEKFEASGCSYNDAKSWVHMLLAKQLGLREHDARGNMRVLER